MYVDVVTYLFNFLAERFKHQVQETSSIRPRDGRLYRLYLELVPPLISVTTLLVVTVLGLRDAIKTLRESPKEQINQPDIRIMLWFSGMNLLLDFLNVTCFARVNQEFGMSQLQNQYNIFRSQRDDDESAEGVPTEATVLLSKLETGNRTITRLDSPTEADDCDASEASDDTRAEGGLNLNMCSAWTHICADTLRSLAVLIAATFATAFPNLLTAADADSWGSIVVSIVILASLVPLFEGLYVTACKIHDLWHSKHRHRRKADVH